MSTTYKIRVLFYQGDEKTPVDIYDLSGQEIQSLESTIRNFTPKSTYLNIDDDFEMICQNDKAERVPFPEEWQAAYVDTLIDIKPRQYGLNPWPKKMYMKFERI